MLYEVMTGKGLGNNAAKSGNRLAAERQTELEHNELLDPAVQFPVQYAEALAMPPGPARSAMLDKLKYDAEEVEKEYPKYWNDQNPRKPIAQSSSFIGNIDYSPEGNMATVTMGNHVYHYVLNPKQMADWVNSPSMEDYYHNFIKR